jgi:hypothetical protein
LLGHQPLFVFNVLIKVLNILRNYAGTIHFMFYGRFGISQTGSEDALRRTLTDFFIKKSAPANSKKGFYTSRLPKNEETSGIFV